MQPVSFAHEAFVERFVFPRHAPVEHEAAHTVVRIIIFAAFVDIFKNASGAADRKALAASNDEGNAVVRKFPFDIRPVSFEFGNVQRDIFIRKLSAAFSDDVPNAERRSSKLRPRIGINEYFARMHFFFGKHVRSYVFNCGKDRFVFIEIFKLFRIKNNKFFTLFRKIRHEPCRLEHRLSQKIDIAPVEREVVFIFIVCRFGMIACIAGKFFIPRFQKRKIFCDPIGKRIGVVCKLRVHDAFKNRFAASDTGCIFFDKIPDEHFSEHGRYGMTAALFCDGVFFFKSIPRDKALECDRLYARRLRIFYAPFRPRNEGDIGRKDKNRIFMFEIFFQHIRNARRFKFNTFHNNIAVTSIAHKAFYRYGMIQVPCHAL